MNNLKKFYLIGHSFGGYMAGMYAVKYPQYVEKLILASPLGIRVAPEGEEWEDRFKKRQGNGYTGPPKWVRPTVSYVWKAKSCPLQLLRILGPYQGEKMIGNYVSNRFGQNITDTENEAIANLLYQTTMRPGTTETSIMVLFTPAFAAHLPLGDDQRLGSPSFPVPVSILYGDNDWMKNVEDDSASLVIEKNKEKHGDKSRLITISDSGHNMHIDNSDMFA